MKSFALVLMPVFAVMAPLAAGAEDAVGGYEKQYQYWPDGKVMTCDVHDFNGYLIGKVEYRHDGSIQKVERFDTRGNKVEESLYDAAGNLSAGIDGWAAMRWRYEDGRLVSQIIYGADGRPVERKRYGETGSLIGRDYIDRGEEKGLDEFNPDSIPFGREEINVYRPDGSVEDSAFVDNL